MIYRILYRLLNDAEGIRNRVGTKIFAENAPQQTRGEVIVLNRISETPDYHLAGESDCARSVVQVDFYAADPVAGEIGYQLIRNRLSGYSGEVSYLSDGAEATTRIHESRILRTNTLTDEPADASDKWVHRVSADFEIFWQQSVPTLT